MMAEDARGALRAVMDLVFPSRCAGCGRGGIFWCAGCRQELSAASVVRAARPQPQPAGFPPTWAATPYAGAVRHALAAYKDDERRDLVGELGLVLAAPLERALQEDSGGRTPTLVVPVPTSRAARRRRGDAPMVGLAQVAADAVSDHAVRLWPGALVTVRAVADQAGLDAVGRASNLAGAFAAPRPLRGASVVLVDDVVTTGATLAEAARALRAGGAGSVTAACIAATVRRSGEPSSAGQGQQHGTVLVKWHGVN